MKPKYRHINNKTPLETLSVIVKRLGLLLVVDIERDFETISVMYIVKDITGEIVIIGNDARLLAFELSNHYDKKTGQVDLCGKSAAFD